MTTPYPTRRSPRSIERVCNGLDIPGLDNSQTALLLSLAYSTGWSADRISLKIGEVTGVELTAEQVYMFHCRWIIDRSNRRLSVEESELMSVLLREAGVRVSGDEAPLSETDVPVCCPPSNSVQEHLTSRRQASNSPSSGFLET